MFIVFQIERKKKKKHKTDKRKNAAGREGEAFCQNVKSLIIDKGSESEVGALPKTPLKMQGKTKNIFTICCFLLFCNGNFNQFSQKKCFILAFD